MENTLLGLHDKYINRETVDVTFKMPETGEKYIRRFQAPSRLVILGGGHVAQSICHFAAQLEFDVTVTDDRPAFANEKNFPLAHTIICDTFEKAIETIKITKEDYVAIVTRGHRHDADCLRVILGKEMPAYLGLIGSKRRVGGLFDLLEEEGYSREKMNEIYSPIGVSIGAVTPDEIAVSILAELIHCRSKVSSRQNEKLLEQINADLGFLKYLDETEEKAVALVVERAGSTPVKTGAIMAVNRKGEIYGTVGGGCGEHEVITAALDVLDGGGDMAIHVDMTDDVAEDEGMVCGGRMTLIIVKVGGKKV